MPEPCTYKIGEISVALIPEFHDGHFDTPRKFESFRTHGPADINLTIHSTHVSDFPNEQMIFERGLTWRQYRSRDQYVLRVKSAQQDPRLVGVFSQDFRSGEIFIGPSQMDPGCLTFPLDYPLGELYMVNLLGTGLGVMLHSCGVICQGTGLIFSGLSGFGKTTTARLWQQKSAALVVNDERVIVRKMGEEFRMYGTPWHGAGGMALPDDAPLQRIFIIKHAASNQLLPLSPVQAVHGLLARSFPPYWSTEGLKFTLQFLADLCQEIPVFEFGFLPDQSAVDFICNLLD